MVEEGQVVAVAAARTHAAHRALAARRAPRHPRAARSVSRSSAPCPRRTSAAAGGQPDLRGVRAAQARRGARQLGCPCADALRRLSIAAC